MKVLVTGGAGFIGSHVVDEIVNQGYEAIVVDNFSTGKWDNIHVKARVYQEDILSDKLNDIFQFERPEYVIHLAAQSSVSRSIAHPQLDCQVNVLGTINLLENCKNYGVKKMIYSSSAAVYGNPLSLPIEENHLATPLSFYGISKYVPEQYILNYHHLFGLEYTILRYSNVFGWRQDCYGEGGVISIFIDRFLNNQPLIVFGDGNQTRDFIYVRDVARANLMALESKEQGIFNISSNKATTINDLIDVLSSMEERSCKTSYRTERPGDIKYSVLSNVRARDVLGWEPNYFLPDGLKETIDYNRLYIRTAVK